MENRIFLWMMILFILSTSIFAGQEDWTGIKIMAGARYDNIRMCVGSDAGVKGGPIADIMFLTKKQFTPGQVLALEIPVMRPILFGAAFEMLQFEPQLTLQFTGKKVDNRSLIFGPGLGVSLHYGPDYNSSLDDRGDPFFAAGPMVSGLIGIRTVNKNNKIRNYGIRIFYLPLFSSETDLSPGTVLGLVFESHFQF